jgi:Ser/Thr protein kinase RdoA (MazF antagonist)
MLVNEYLLNELLSKKIASYASNYTFPNSIEYFKDATSFSAVFEFVDGTLLTTYPLEKQAEVVAGAIDFISKISSGLSIDERSRFVQRPFSYYLFLLPIITVASALADIRNAGTIFSVAGSALSTAPQLARTLALAHRDITPDNIMIAGESAYILDTENMVLTLPGYDYAYLCATPDHQELVQMLPARFVTRNSAFLQKYITLHHILGSGEFLKVNSRYVDLLRKLRT